MKSGAETEEDILKKKISRRAALSTAGKIATGVIVAGVVAGVGGYYAGSAAAPAKTVTKTATVTKTQAAKTVTSTVTKTVGTAPAATVTSTVTKTVTSVATQTAVKWPRYIPPEEIDPYKVPIEPGDPALPGPVLQPAGEPEYTLPNQYKKEPPWVIALSYCGGGIAWDEMWIRAFEKRVKSWGDLVDKVIIKKALFSQDTQIEQLEELWNMRDEIDALVIVPISGTALEPYYKKFYEYGIPVINALDPYYGKYVTVNRSIDDRIFGAMMALWLVKKLKGKGNVVVLRGPYIPCGNLRWDYGAKPVLEQYPDIKILEVVNAAFSYDKGKKLMEDLLSAYGEKIDGVLSQAGSTTMGCVEAFLEMGFPLVPMTGELYNGLLGYWLEYHDKTNFDTCLYSERMETAIDAAMAVRCLLEGIQIKRNVLYPPVWVPTEEKIIKELYHPDLPKFAPVDWLWIGLTKEEVKELYGG